MMRRSISLRGHGHDVSPGGFGPAEIWHAGRAAFNGTGAGLPTPVYDRCQRLLGGCGLRASAASSSAARSGRCSRRDAAQVVLVLGLGLPEVADRRDLGHHLARPEPEALTSAMVSSATAFCSGEV